MHGREVSCFLFDSSNDDGLHYCARCRMANRVLLIVCELEKYWENWVGTKAFRTTCPVRKRVLLAFAHSMPRFLFTFEDNTKGSCKPTNKISRLCSTPSSSALLQFCSLLKLMNVGLIFVVSFSSRRFSCCYYSFLSLAPSNPVCRLCGPSQLSIQSRALSSRHLFDKQTLSYCFR